MDKGYEVYCHADASFYDLPTAAPSPGVDFELARGPVPSGWQRFELDDWLVYGPMDVQVPPQGWKVHASACLDNAERILAQVWDYCVTRSIPFKFIRNRELLFLRNGKYANRGASGKFVTIYPRDEAQFELILNELGARLEGETGPYILSDLRWGDGPLYVRYGGFADRYCVSEDGEIEAAITDANGQAVPDRRGPTFYVPDWVTLPQCLAPHLEARNSATVQDIPYRIEEPLHFSNGGGVYKAVDVRTEETVVLKEARPYAGLAHDGADAVKRLQHERKMLERLAGLELVPAVHDYFTLGDHHFLVQEFIEATPFRERLVYRFPLIRPDPDEAALADYAADALELYGRVEAAIEAIHGRDVVIGDLHPYNILVRPDGRVALIDLEVANDVSESGALSLAAPDFLPPDGVTGFDIDRYALACLRLYMFLPITSLFLLAPEKAEELASEIAELFPVPPEFVSEAADTIMRAHGEPSSGHERPAGGRPLPLEPDPVAWEPMRDSMATAILSSATPEREDRLFPGDIKGFPAGGLSIAYGAAGVLYALHATGAGRYPEHEEWLVRRASDPVPGTGVGFLEGLHGVAYVLDRLGRRDDALKVLEVCLSEAEGKRERGRLGLDLRAGLAGVGLNLAYFASATGDASLWDSVWEIADEVADRLGTHVGEGELSGGEHPFAGLPRGSTGPALLFLRLYEQNRDEALLDLAATALRQDLGRCVLRDGMLLVNEGWRICPYVAEGSAGIGLVLDDYLALRDDEQFRDASAATERAAGGWFYAEPGLFWGRAGMILYFSRRHAAGRAALESPVVAGHVRRLAWHALSYRGGLAFPGEWLARLSMDLATGTAGVMLALGAALHDQPVYMPFLEPLARERVSDRSDLVLASEGR